MKILFAVSVFFLFLAACSGATVPSSAPAADVNGIQTQAALSIFATQTASVPTATITPTCDAREFLEQSDESLAEFKDITIRAQKTPRSGLSPVIGEMQTARRTYAKITAPDCSKDVQQAILAAMDAQIDVLLKFLGQESDAVVQAGLKKADAALAAAEQLVSDRKAGKETTALGANTPTPTADLAATLNSLIPARGAYKHTYEVKEEFDRIRNETVVSLSPPLSEFRTRPGGLEVLYAYPGKTPTIPDQVTFEFVHSSDDWTYLDCHSLTLLLDGKDSLPLDTNHDGKVGSGYVLEFISANLTPQIFLRIVNSKTIEGKLCNDTFILSDSQHEALRDLASRMRP